MEQKKKTNSDYDKEKLDERIGRMNQSVAVLKVGGASETEVNELKDNTTVIIRNKFDEKVNISNYKKLNVA
jgi:chaperonin GroEL (HSP60 family)